ncbi:hypothetical protein [Halomonas sp. H2]|uniref:hypothetical protein n=1 Tax=Halomonas sp. H2 TaxID=261936 RepID=UPI003CF0421E
MIAETTLRKYSQKIANDLPEDMSALQEKKLNDRVIKSHDKQNNGDIDGMTQNKDNSLSTTEPTGKKELHIAKASLLTLSFYVSAHKSAPTATP